VEAAGIEQLAVNEISATRDYTFDETQVLAKEREQEILRAALARDLVVLVMRRISSL
jgi:LPS-assembly lipoprotein